MMASEKLKAFAERILRKCEQEGFTINEAAQLPVVLRIAIEDRIGELHRSIRISAGAPAHRDTSHRDSHTG